MAGPPPITLVLVGTLRARVPTVGAGCDMVVLTGPTAITGVRAIALVRGGAPTSRACCLEAVVMTVPVPITLVLVGPLPACVPAVGAGCDMVVLTGAAAVAGVRTIALAR